ncbi:hypothetical protein KC976_04120 [Candidatus Saccharibacteria bacterium]|nr:hypothetical protein [Candidatus Saccharibacteria bacterium]MCA9368115.1 hypothetical protein [Candidatus Kaiserbacteria bacterium]
MKQTVLTITPMVQWAEQKQMAGAVVSAGPLVTIPVPPVLIPAYEPGPDGRLSHYLQNGRLYHPLCRNAFVEHVQIGYYAYERREEWRTCALAAAYAGCFGPQSIEKPEFSYSMAIWRLSQRVGFDIGERQVVGPTGRHNNLADEMIKLVDENLWTRAGVAEWLTSIGV